MTKSRARAFKWGMAAVVAVMLAPLYRTWGTSFYGPNVYFGYDGGGGGATPEFYWELEVGRIAKEFHPTEKYLPFHGDEDNSRAQADDKDRAAAVKDGEINPEDDDTNTQQSGTGAAADDNSDTPVDENEFDDYGIGAGAFFDGKLDDAQKAWEGLLKRPAAQRRYRSVWAAFMLGKLALKKNDYAKAVEYFELTRKLAKQGFADTLCLAADSYGWEGRAEWKQGHPDKAAPLYLTQLALGDKSAIVSLKVLIPDRDPVDGMENYDAQPPDKTIDALKFAAADPLLRRLVTAHVLATETDYFTRLENTAPGKRAARWLAIVDAANVGKVQDAEYLGWLAYSNADYKGAARWLALADAATPAACWLRAKLDLRDGKIDDAAKNMARVCKLIGNGDPYAGMTLTEHEPEENPDTQFVVGRDGGGFTFPESAAGDLGLAQLTRADFTQAFDTLLKGGLWEDAAYVAERVLTVDELKAYVDRQPAPPAKADQQQKDDYQRLRYLLGRRLVREDRYGQAAAYLTKPYDQVLARYAQALKDGANEKLPKEQRAKAWFTAAWLARHDGMELMGAEVAPDGFYFGGEFPYDDIAAMRRTRTYDAPPHDPGDNSVKITSVPFEIKVSNEEEARLSKNDIVPDLRFHYRIIAGALAMRAAALLKDNTEELADVLNTAGLWVKDRDNKLGDRYYNVIEARCADTDIGRKVLAQHWFVDVPGSWSQEQETAHSAMLKKLGIEDDQEQQFMPPTP